MYIYILTLLFTYAFALLSRMTFKQEKTLNGNYRFLDSGKYSIGIAISKMSFIISFCIIWLVAGLRVNVGTDFNRYVSLFYDLNNLLFSSQVNIELFYFYFNKIIGLFTDNVQFLFIVSSFLIYSLYYKVTLKESNYFELGLFLFIAIGFYFSSLNIVRQWIACAIIFYSFTFVFKNQIVKFILSTIVATLFHSSAVVVLPFYFLIRKLRKNSTRIIIMLVATVISFMPQVVLNYINSALILVDGDYKYFKYLDSMASSGAGGYVFPLLCLIVFLGYILVKDKISRVNANTEFHINILTIGFAITMMGQSLYILARLHFYFLPILIILIPNIIASFKGWMKIMVYFFVLIFGFIFMIYLLNNNGGEPLPYNSIFN